MIGEYKRNDTRTVTEMMRCQVRVKMTNNTEVRERVSICEVWGVVFGVGGCLEYL